MTEEGPPNILVKTLKASAKALEYHLCDNLEHELATGTLLSRLLGKKYKADTILSPLNEEKIWTEIKDRIEEIFAPGLIIWEKAKIYSPESRIASSEKRLTLGGRLSKSAVALSAKVRNARRRDDDFPEQNLNETYCLSDKSEDKDQVVDSYNKDQFGVALLALFVCCVFDQNKDVYSALYQLEEKAQRRVRFVFQYLIGLSNLSFFFNSVQELKFDFHILRCCRVLKRSFIYT